MPFSHVYQIVNKNIFTRKLRLRYLLQRRNEKSLKMTKILFYVFSLLIIATLSNAGIGDQDPEIYMDALQIITRWGYHGEKYTVTSNDGYILEIHRIPYGRAGPGTKERPVIFLQHGLMADSTQWIMNLPEQSAGFLFADAGFDVWLGNFRGNTYGKKHQTLDPRDHKFWEFSWDEMAKYDLEVIINKALEISGQEQLYYVGHSEGTMSAFAKFSTDIEFGKKIKTFFALAPVVHLKHMRGLLAYLAPLTPEIGKLLEWFGEDEFAPSNWFTKWMAKYFCGLFSTNILCDNIMFLIAGPESNQMNTTRVPVYFAHMPAGTSVQNIIHFAQMAHSNKFQAFDYGSKEKNELHYRQDTPYEYPLESMQVPWYAFHGDSDWLADPRDVADTLNRFTTLEDNYLLKGFNHLDFMYGLNAPTEVYQKILDIINE